MGVTFVRTELLCKVLSGRGLRPELTPFIDLQGNPMNVTIPRLRTALCGALLASTVCASLSGCFYSAASTTIRATSIHKMENREKFRTALKSGYQHYLQEAQGSGCPEAEYAISPSVFQFVESEGDSQMQKTEERMKAIYADKAYSEKSRAEAVYYLALIYMRPATENHWIAEDYIKRLKTEFPGQRDCIADWLMNRIVTENPEDYAS